MRHLFLALALLVGSHAWAQEDAVAPVSSQTPLDVVTVAASRGERIDLDVPASVTVVDVNAERIRRPPHSLVELLHTTPGVHAQATGPGQGSPLVRGLTGYHVLTLIDGIRLNGSFFRSGPNQYNALIDPLTIDQVEVVRGPGSVLHGSDALGGVIAVRSRSPEAPAGLLPEAEAWGRARAYGHLWLPLREGGEESSLGRLELEGGVGPAAALVGFDYHGVGDREAGRHHKTLAETQYHEVNGDAKFVYAFSPRETLTVAAQRAEQRNAPRTHSTLYSESWRGTSVGSDRRRDLNQSRQLVYAQLEARERGPFSRIKGSLSLQRMYESEHRVRGSGGETRTGFEVWTLGAFVEAESDLPLPIDTTLCYGVDHYHDFVDSFETDQGVHRTRGPIADDAHYDLFGAYVRLEVHLERWLDLTAGVRYSLAHVLAREVDPDPSDPFAFGRLEETYDAVVGSAGFALHPTTWLSLVGSAAQGFRAPNLDDTTAFRAVSSSSFDSPSPDLDPERSLTLEAGLKWRAAWCRGQLFYAYTFLDDFIQRVPTGNQVPPAPDPSARSEFTKANVSEGAIQTVDGQLELLLDPLARTLSLDLPPLGLSLISRFSWTRGRVDALVAGGLHADHLRRAPPASYSGVLRWTEPTSGWLWAELEAEVVRHQHRLSAEDLADGQRIPPGGSPGYTLWHVRVGCELWERRLRCSLGVLNLFDRDYRVHGSGTNGWGRTLVGAIEATW